MIEPFVRDARGARRHPGDGEGPRRAPKTRHRDLGDGTSKGSSKPESASVLEAMDRRTDEIIEFEGLHGLVELGLPTFVTTSRA